MTSPAPVTLQHNASVLLVAALSRTSVFVTLSCQPILVLDQSLCWWSSSSFLVCLLYSVWVLVEFFQFLGVSFVHCLGFGSVQQGGQNDTAGDLHFRGELYVVVADHVLPQSPLIVFTGFVDAVAYFQHWKWCC